MWAHVVVLFEMPLARNRHAPRADCGKRPFFPPREPLLLRLFSDDVDAGASAARASREMSYGGGYGGYGGGGYGSGSGSSGRPRNVGAFAPQESFSADPSSGMRRGAYGGGYGQNAGPGPARAPPGVGAFSVQDASRPAYAQQPPGGYQPPGGGGFQPAQRRFGDGGYGGYGAGAPQMGRGAGAGGYGGYAAAPPRAAPAGGGYGGSLEMSGRTFGRADSEVRGGYGGGYGGDPAPTMRAYGGEAAQALRRSDAFEASADLADASSGGTAFSLANAASATSASAGQRPRLGASAFVNPQRELVVPQATHPEGTRPTFSLEKFGITGDNQSAHDRASSAGGTRFSSRAGSGANSPGSASPPGAGGAADGGVGGPTRPDGRRLPLYVGADLPIADASAPAASPASAAFAQASALAQRRQAAAAAASAAGSGDVSGYGKSPLANDSATRGPGAGPEKTIGATFSAPRRAAAVDSATASSASAIASRARSFNDPHKKRPLITSATVQSHFFFGFLFYGTFVLTCLLILIWKGCRLPYPSTGANRWGLDVAYLVAYALVEPARLFLGSVANKALRANWMYLSLVLAVPVFGLHAYYAWGQTYALKIDVFLNVCGMGFVGAQVALSLFVVGVFPGSGLGVFGSFGSFDSRSNDGLHARRARLDLTRRGSSGGGFQQSAARRFGGFQVQ